MSEELPSLAEVSETRDTLQAYSRILSAVRRARLPAHPNWWHISLQVEPRGLLTGPLPADGRAASFDLAMNLLSHRLEIAAGAETRRLDLEAAPSAAELGEQVLGELAALGIEPGADRALWHDASPRVYRGRAAGDLRHAFAFSADVFEGVRVGLAGDRGPLQLWPHHFDLSFEWFGTVTVPPESGSSAGPARGQIGFGFSTGDDDHPAPYYYATPWPFAEELTEVPLPAGAGWQRDPWQGALLPWKAVRQGGRELLAAFLESVHQAAAPRLTAIE